MPRFAEFVSAAAPPGRGAVPATVTVTELVTELLLGPRIVKTYVVVAAGFSCLLPRGVAGPMPGSIVNPAGFSVAHTNCVDSPGLIDAGRASKVTTRGSG